MCTLVGLDQLHTNSTEASLAYPVGVYGKRKAMYDSMKYDTSRQEKFQIYGEEEYIEVSERKILRAVRNIRRGSAGCFANYEMNVDSRLRCEIENMKTKFKSKTFLPSNVQRIPSINNDKTAPKVTHIKSGTLTFSRNVQSRFTVGNGDSDGSGKSGGSRGQK